jgi:hypothetical protein
VAEAGALLAEPAMAADMWVAADRVHNASCAGPCNFLPHVDGKQDNQLHDDNNWVISSEKHPLSRSQQGYLLLLA